MSSKEASSAGGGGHKFKIVLLGEGCVGKTSLVLRYVEDKFNSKHISTLQASFLTKRININGESVLLNIWDTAGQERFHALGPIYYRSSNAAILVYDITDVDSFTKVHHWVKELKKALGTEVVLCIVGNKTDLEKDRKINADEAVSYSESVGAKHFDTSAKFNDGIEELFYELTTLMIEKQELKRNSMDTALTNSSDRNELIISDETEMSDETSHRSCCSN